jgi:exodeoxyribonuclease VII large subunit
LRDVVNVLRRRFPLAEVILAPTAVQGEEAPAGIVAALQALNRVARPEVILLVRGGGSLEDLAAFNDEDVARAMCASTAPVVSGVGHETDFTIADFAADPRSTLGGGGSRRPTRPGWEDRPEAPSPAGFGDVAGTAQRCVRWRAAARLAARSSNAATSGRPWAAPARSRPGWRSAAPPSEAWHRTGGGRIGGMARLRRR